jgi:hypothetical protein
MAESLKSEIGVVIEKHREPLCVWSAIEYLLRTSEDPFEAYSFKYANKIDGLYAISAPFPPERKLKSLMQPISLDDIMSRFPILLVNVKTGSAFYRGSVELR